MSVPENFDDVLAMALRYVQTGDEGEIAAAISEMGAVDGHQALAIMRGSGNEMSAVEQLVALAVIQQILTRAEGIQVMDEVADVLGAPRP